jgi:hypothetical protein
LMVLASSSRAPAAPVLPTFSLPVLNPIFQHRRQRKR